jgi:DnaJ domain
MATKTITIWLRRKRRNDCAASLLLAGATLVTGLGAIFLLFALFWFICLLLAPRAMDHLSLAWPLGFTSVVTVFFLLDSLHSRRDDLSNVMLWLLRESFGIGPRLLQETFHCARHAAELARLNVATCAKVLEWLATKNKSVSRDELRRVFPDLAWPELRPQLALIEGVLFLRADFSRITLSQPLRLTLRRLLLLQPPVFEQEPERERAEPTPVKEPEELSAYEILGVSDSATLSEIKQAYRTRVKECHPDRFAGMDATSRFQAEEWTKALNAAYATLSAQHARRT